MNGSQRLSWLLWGALALGIIAFYLPWLWHPAAGLAPNGYDLAEWASLHPQARQASPALLPSLLLRAEMALLSALVVFHAVRHRGYGRWAGLGVAVLLVLTLLPPLDFFLSAQGDGNYQQQFGLAVVALGLSGISWWSMRWPRRLQFLFLVLLVAAGSASGIVGLAQSGALLNAFGITFAVGAGSILTIGAFVLVGVLLLWERWQPFS